MLLRVELRSVLIIPSYSGEGEMTDCKKHRGINFLIVMEKTYAEILVDRVRRLSERLMIVTKVFSNQRERIYLDEKPQDKKHGLYVGYMNLGRA